MHVLCVLLLPLLFDIITVQSMLRLPVAKYVLIFSCIYNYLLTMIFSLPSVSPWPSGGGSNVTMAVDNSISSTWVSEPCKIGPWVSNPEFNILLNTCLSPLCMGSCNSSADALQYITDGQSFTSSATWMNQGIGSTWARIPIPTGPSNIVKMYLRGVWPINSTLSATLVDGSTTVLHNLDPTFSYQEIYIDVSTSSPVTELSLRTNTRDGIMRGFCYANVGDCKTMFIYELAARSKDCYEQLTLDLGVVRMVQQLIFQSSGFVAGNIYTSIDGLNYYNRSSLSRYANARGAQTLNVGHVTARYVRFRS